MTDVPSGSRGRILWKNLSKRALHLVALLRKMICNLGDPMSLRHPVLQVTFKNLDLLTGHDGCNQRLSGKNTLEKLEYVHTTKSLQILVLEQAIQRKTYQYYVLST